MKKFMKKKLKKFMDHLFIDGSKWPKWFENKSVLLIHPSPIYISTDISYFLAFADDTMLILSIENICIFLTFVTSLSIYVQFEVSSWFAGTFSFVSLLVAYLFTSTFSWLVTWMYWKEKYQVVSTPSTVKKNENNMKMVLWHTLF